MDPRAGPGSDAGSRSFFQEELLKLLEFARFEGKLRRPADGKNSTSERAQLEALRERFRRTGEKPRGELAAQLARLDEEGPELPDSLGYLWSWFLELDNSRDITISGPAPLTYVSIDSWSRLLDRNIRPYEVAALISIDIEMRIASSAKKLEESTDE